MNISPHPRGSRGFTLIELLIVVVIIGILATIAIPKFSAARENAFRAAMMTDLKNIAHFQELYYNDNFSFADDLDVLEAETSDGVTIEITEATESGWAATAAHDGLDEAELCGVFHGEATPGDGNPATSEGVIACTIL